MLLIAGLRALPGWVLSRAEIPLGADALAGWATVAGLVLEVILWPILGLALLLGPIVVVAECGVAAALRQWYGLLRRHLSRVLLYEALAVALGVVAVLPLLLPIVLAGSFALADGPLFGVRWATLSVLGGLALSPLFAYLVVANVYIYLNLRYEFTPAGK